MITANEIKTRGVKVIEENLNEYNEAFISVHGKPKYAIITIEQYDEFRGHEITNAYNEIKQDIKNEDYVIESVQEHMDRLWKDEA